MKASTLTHAFFLALLLQPSITLVIPHNVVPRVPSTALNLVQKPLQSQIPAPEHSNQYSNQYSNPNQSPDGVLGVPSNPASRTTQLTAMGGGGSSGGEAASRGYTKLTVEEESGLSNQVQVMVRLKNEKDKLHSKLDRTPTDEEWANVVGCSTKTLKDQIKKSQHAKQKLVTANVGMVAKIARNYGTHGVPLADLMQEGNLGLLEAADRFDPSKGFKFCTYATYWIRQRISRSIANHSRVIRLPVPVHLQVNNIKKTMRLMEAGLGRKPTTAEVAKHLNIPESKINLIMESSKKTISLDQQATNGPDDHRVLGDRIVWEGVGPEEHTVASELRSDLFKSMDDFDSRERMVIGLRFGLDDGNFLSCAEVAKRVGVSKERVRMIEAKAINKLRHPSRNLRLKEYFLGLFEH